MKLFGISQNIGQPWYYLQLMLGNRMLVITPYTLKTKLPKYYYYNKESFEYSLSINLINPRWFIGLIINQIN